MASVKVRRRVIDVAKALDPQSWSRCSMLFEETYLAHWSGGVVRDPPVPLSRPYGGALGPRSLFEHYVCRASGCDNVFFDNLLHVTTKWAGPEPGQGEYTVIYSLEKFIASSTPNATILRDEGTLWAEEGPDGETTAFVEKTIQYARPEHTAIAEAAFRAADLGGEAAALLCCVAE
jgi:hypothetical protein